MERSTFTVDRRGPPITIRSRRRAARAVARAGTRRNTREILAFRRSIPAAFAASNAPLVSDTLAAQQDGVAFSSQVRCCSGRALSSTEDGSTFEGRDARVSL